MEEGTEEAKNLVLQKLFTCAVSTFFLHLGQKPPTVSSLQKMSNNPQFEVPQWTGCPVLWSM